MSAATLANGSGVLARLSPLARARHRAEKQVHEHGLAAPDRTAEVEPEARLRTGTPSEAESGEPAAASGFGPIVKERMIKALQPLDRQLLRRVRFEQPLPAQGAVGGDRLVGRPRGRMRERQDD
jgi:hypothetical protein